MAACRLIPRRRTMRREFWPSLACTTEQPSEATAPSSCRRMSSAFASPADFLPPPQLTFGSGVPFGHAGGPDRRGGLANVALALSEAFRIVAAPQSLFEMTDPF